LNISPILLGFRQEMNGGDGEARTRNPLEILGFLNDLEKKWENKREKYTLQIEKIDYQR